MMDESERCKRNYDTATLGFLFVRANPNESMQCSTEFISYQNMQNYLEFVYTQPSLSSCNNLVYLPIIPAKSRDSKKENLL